MNKLAIVGLGLILAVGIGGVSFAAETSVTGHLRDAFCYNIAGASGPGHHNCAVKCAKAGIPVALVQKDGTQIILLSTKNAKPLPDAIISKMEDEVTVTGNEYKKGGITYLQVESVK